MGPYSGGRALFQTSGVEPHLKGVLFKVNFNLKNLLEVIIIRGRYFYRVHYTLGGGGLVQESPYSKMTLFLYLRLSTFKSAFSFYLKGPILEALTQMRLIRSDVIGLALLTLID